MPMNANASHCIILQDRNRCVMIFVQRELTSFQWKLVEVVYVQCFHSWYCSSKLHFSLAILPGNVTLRLFCFLRWALLAVSNKSIVIMHKTRQGVKAENCGVCYD